MTRRYWQLALQATVTLALLAWLISRLDWHTLGQTLAGARLPWLAAGVASYLFSLAVGAVRWRTIMNTLSRPVPLSRLLTVYWVGAFFNQALPGAVSGDAVRALYIRQAAGGLPLASAAILAERLFGLGAMVVLVVTGYGTAPAEHAGLPELATLVALMAIGYPLAVGLLLHLPLDQLLAGRLPALAAALGEARLALRAVFRRGPALLSTAVLSLIVQVFWVGVFWCVGHALSLPLDRVALWVIWPLVSLVATLPISLAGWGVREGLLVFYLAGLGIAGHYALAVSLLAGLAVLLASLPGGLVWLWLHRPPVGGAHRR